MKGDVKSIMALIEDGMTASDIKLLEKLLPEYYNPDTLGCRTEEINWDEEFKSDILTGKGFVAYERPFDKTRKKNMNGIHSPRFGTSFEDDNAFAERYRCQCGNMIGKIYEGEICKDCGTKVQFVDTDLKIFAWYHIKHGYKAIAKSDILYIEVIKHDLTFHCASGTYTTRMPMKEIEAKLGKGFCKCSNSFLVNLSALDSVVGDDVVMPNGERLPIARSKKKSFTEAFLSSIG
jgi:hypothetical protein